MFTSTVQRYRRSLTGFVRTVICFALICVCVSVDLHPARAMQFRSLAPDDQGNVAITGTGEIVAGDLERLRTLMLQLSGTMSATGRVNAIFLDSPGGALIEAERLADVIQKVHLAVVVPAGSQCASACFLLFAAGSLRIVGPDALVGVHSASQAGHETEASMAITTALARDAAQMGVPPQIVGKMVETKPGRMEWLTRDDLALMDVRIVDPGDTPAPASASPPMAMAPSVTPSPPPIAAPVTPALEQSARRFLSLYFGNWSANNTTSMAYVTNIYADTVDFYGAETPRQTIIDLKRKFVERWPERIYAVRPNSVRIDCDQQTSTCVVAGLVDWDCRNASRAARSSGLASFTVKVAFSQSGVAQVIGEAGSVVSRSATR